MVKNLFRIFFNNIEDVSTQAMFVKFPTALGFGILYYFTFIDFVFFNININYNIFIYFLLCVGIRQNDNINENLKKINLVKFVSPFARYLAILPLAEKERLEELARTEAENKKKKLCPEKSDNLEEYVSDAT